MRKILLTIGILLLLPSLAIASGLEESEDTTIIEDVKAEQTMETVDENTVKTTSKYFDLVLTRSSQLPFGKKVTYEISITPHLDSSKTQILWEVPTTMDVNPRHSEFVSIAEGETKTYKATITPNREGTYVVNVNVVSWQYDTNYTNSIKDTITFDENLVLQPVSTAYILGNALKIFLIIILFAALGLLTFVLVKNNTAKIKKWLTPDF
jgi:hypothetical protein